MTATTTTPTESTTAAAAEWEKMFENGATPYTTEPFLTDLLKANCPRGSRAMDIGAAYGRDSLFLANELGCTVVAVEPTVSGSEAMKASASSPKLKVLNVSASEIPWRDDDLYSFILLDSVLQFIAEGDRPGVVSKAVDHLTPNGVLMVASHPDEHAAIVLPLLDALAPAAVTVREEERTLVCPFEMVWEGEAFEAAFHVALVRPRSSL